MATKKNQPTRNASVPTGATGATGATGKYTGQSATGATGSAADQLRQLYEMIKGNGSQSVATGVIYPASRTPIGVEGAQYLDVTTGKPTGYQGYTATRPAPAPQGFGATRSTPTTVTVQPKYFSGDEDQIATFSPETIAIIQQSLAANNLMSRNYLPGVVDDKTRSGFRELLGIANRQGADWNTTLATVSQIRTTSLGQGTLPKYKLSNPDDLKAVFRKAAQDALGRNLGDGDLERLVSAYQQQELQYQQKMAVGGVVTQTPSAETFAANAIQKDFGDEVDKRKMESIFSAVDSALSGGK